MTIISTQTVTSGDLLTLAALPVPTMIFDVEAHVGFDRQVDRQVIAASVPTARRVSHGATLTTIPNPRPARLHTALEGAL